MKTIANQEFSQKLFHCKFSYSWKEQTTAHQPNKFYKVHTKKN